LLAEVISGALRGVDAFLVRVEVDLAKGLPAMSVVGLAESAVREGRERVMAALANAGLKLPPRRITVNLAPADVHKGGSAFDLPLALGLLAAAGQHNLLMVGPPGSGKSMLARRLPGILPPLTLTESIEVTKVYSVAGRLRPNQALVHERPFRAPHHTTSDAAMVGGGALSRPGEVTLAHRGVLFLDELPEFRRNVLESLRQPIEDATVMVGRARAVLAYPASLMLVAAMNPCPCGYFATGTPCICSAMQVQRYVARVSGPLLDRIDLHVSVPPVVARDLGRNTVGESSETIRTRVVAARERQLLRYHDVAGVFANAQLGVREVNRFCRIDASAERMMQSAMRSTGLSARAYHRVLRLARTIADLDGVDAVLERHVAEAVNYRTIDRNGR
jgi:magnesium chelatase family protein